MNIIDKSEVPGANNSFHEEHACLLVESFHRVCGKDLLPNINHDNESEKPAGHRPIGEALFDADIVVVSHGTEDDPIFNYANRRALRLFEMDWQTFTNLPSRKSAEPLHRDARETLMRTVREKGFIDNYAGIRISGSGRRFEISNAVVWNIVDSERVLRGQAATFTKVKHL